MKKEEIHLGDIKRLLFGQTPPEFMIEVALRTVLIYMVLLTVVRFLGKRMSGQITVVELSVMITLGAIISPVMQLPDRGIVYGIIGLLVALTFQRGINLLSFKKEKIEHLTSGKMSLLIKDGVMVLDELAKAHVTKQQVFSMLREKKIATLGEVKRAYLEACGILSVFETEEEKPGLPVFPAADGVIKSILKESEDSIMACSNCGHVQKAESKTTPCELCNAADWSKAYTSN